MDSVVEAVGVKLQEYLVWLVKYFGVEESKFEENWGKLMAFLENFKIHLTSNFKAQEQKAERILQEARIKIK